MVKVKDENVNICRMMAFSTGRDRAGKKAAFLDFSFLLI
jgi:hypothetical protein